MKLLLDESIPVRLADHFPTEISVSTVSGNGWAGTKNGALLARTTSEGFRAFITADKGIEYQQNLISLSILSSYWSLVAIDYWSSVRWSHKSFGYFGKIPNPVCIVYPNNQYMQPTQPVFTPFAVRKSRAHGSYG